MKQLEPVIWTKGTFLSPQHLQRQDRFLEDLLRFQCESLCFRPWGFRALEISQTALAAGTFGISRASGIFPDGLLFDIPDADSAPAPKPLTNFLANDRDTVEVYLAIPQYYERGVNVAGSDGDTRYRPEVELLRDENVDGSEKPVRVARKNLRLLVEDESREGYTTIRVGRVRRTEAGLFQLDPGFVPPSLDFYASPYLVTIARRLVEILSARSSAIAGMRRQKNQSLAEFTTADIANFWLLYTVNSALPLVRHLLETRHGHPERLFTAMLTLAGALTTFSVTTHTRDLPSYDHDQLGDCFAALDEKLRALLDTVIPANFVALPLKRVQNAIYAASIEDDKYFVNSRMYLAINAELPQADLVSRAPQLVKVCSLNEIDHLVRQALPGVTLTYVASPPAAIAVKVNYQYFGIGQGGVAWETIRRARNLAVYVPADLPNPQLELLIVLPQGD
ncbi:MAG TPA: type VI secretion system baseplate subunit TssK [Bryobacteraceae bacterium]|jgi:type VI secretion system protein ImpJ